MKKHIIKIILLLFMFHSTMGQELNALLNAYIGENAKEYIQPVVDLFGANLNTGRSEWAKLDSGFHIRITAIGSSSFPVKKMKVFEAASPANFIPTSINSVPTIIGKNESLTITGINETGYSYAPGYNVNHFLLLAPQISAGSFFNTELTASYIAFDLEDDFGKLNYFGAGFRHTLDNYIAKLPFSLNIGYMFQSLDVGDEISIKSHLPSIWLGKASKKLSCQLMMGYQITDAKLSYTYTGGTSAETVALELKNETPLFAEISAGLKLGFLVLHAAGSYSGPFTGAVGLTFKF
ncbi:MAG TPA: DUF6588 family protein [Chitinophagaceae bacterium]|nr:DUF6588 family protein [Chitinophagaceae bacterium]